MQQQAGHLERAMPMAGPPASASPRPTLQAALRPTAAALVSVVIHAALLVCCALLVLHGGDPEGIIGEQEVQIASLPETQLQDNVATLQAAAAAVDKPSESLELVELSPIAASQPADTNWEVVLGSANGIAAGQFEAGDLGGGAMAGQASFMGLQANGSRFCIIADCSGSMRRGKLEFVKREVLRTIGGLTGRTRFQIYFFNNSAVAFPREGWRNPLVDVGTLREWLSTINANGGTIPNEAFERAFGLSPRPDAIFFMTDGQFKSGVVRLVERLNRSPRVPIHTITFVDRSAEAMMREIAVQSKGTYRHVGGF
jgi:hypothetical protein